MGSRSSNTDTAAMGQQGSSQRGAAGRRGGGYGVYGNNRYSGGSTAPGQHRGPGGNQQNNPQTQQTQQTQPQTQQSSGGPAPVAQVEPQNTDSFLPDESGGVMQQPQQPAQPSLQDMVMGLMNNYMSQNNIPAAGQQPPQQLNEYGMPVAVDPNPQQQMMPQAPQQGGGGSLSPVIADFFKNTGAKF